MVRWLVEPLLMRFGQAVEHSAPTSYEVGLGHLAYAVGAAFVVVSVGRVSGWVAPVGLNALLTTAGACAALSVLVLYWAVVFRRTPPDLWFFSHLVWLGLTYAFVFLWVSVTALALVAGILFALIVPPLALVLVYGPMLIGAVVLAWFAWRIGRGYVSYLRQSAVGLHVASWRRAGIDGAPRSFPPG